DPSMDAAEVNAAKASCSTDAYNQAFAKYKAAVDGAKLRARGEVCDDGTPLYEIAGNLQAATAKCGKFESIIATSQWAAPAREVDRIARQAEARGRGQDDRIRREDRRGRAALHPEDLRRRGLPQHAERMRGVIE